MDLEAYFISPEGIFYFVPNHHIDFIYYNSTIFNLSQEYIKDYFSKYNEPIPSEGKARNDIIAMLIKQKWIRIRFKNQKKVGRVGHFQLDKWNEESYQNIKRFIENYPHYGEYLIKLIDLNEEPFFYDGWKTINQFFGEIEFGDIHERK